ncbi:MAG: prepilin peptidase [Peptostreptococcaceae bacterium]
MIYTIITSTILSYCATKYLNHINKETSKVTYNKVWMYFVGALLSILIQQKYGLTTDSIRYIFLVPFLITISIIDYKTTYIYDITIVSGIIIQGVILITSINAQKDVQSHIISLMIGYILSYILSKVTKSLGEGDIGLFSLCSFTLGHNYSVYMIFLSFMVAFIYCIYIIITKNKSIKDKIPFAPFISLATILIMLTQSSIITSYIDIIYKVL